LKRKKTEKGAAPEYERREKERKRERTKRKMNKYIQHSGNAPTEQNGRS
jgi:hypothetical protein